MSVTSLTSSCSPLNDLVLLPLECLLCARELESSFPLELARVDDPVLLAVVLARFPLELVAGKPVVYGVDDNLIAEGLPVRRSAVWIENLLALNAGLDNLYLCEVVAVDCQQCFRNIWRNLPNCVGDVQDWRVFISPTNCGALVVSYHSISKCLNCALGHFDHRKS